MKIVYYESYKLKVDKKIKADPINYDEYN